MTSSGSVSFGSSFGLDGVITESFERIQIFGPAMESIHLDSAIRSLNLMFMEWSANGPNPWAVDMQTQVLAVGTQSYNSPAGTVSILQAWRRQTIGSDLIDTLMTPLSRFNYAALGNKLQPGAPTQYYLDRLKTPVIYPWPVADVAGYTFVYYRIKNIEDVTNTLSQTADAPGYWQEAICAGLASKLAVKWAPERARDMALLAQAAYDVAARDDSERGNIQIYPDLTNYQVIF